MTEAVRRMVWERAGDRCEYCGLRQLHVPRECFHVEHIVAVKHRGSDELDNLCLACHRCNLRKGANIAGVDPDGDGTTIVALYHPRRDRWAEHFCRKGAAIVGLTSTGRTTVWVLGMNEERRMELRRLLLANGELD